MGKHGKVRAKIDRKPPPSNLTWREAVSYMESLGFEVLQGSGSRAKFYHRELDRLASFHKPHPNPEMDKGAVNDLREFLESLDL